MSGSLQTALRNRPDISGAIREMRAAGVRLKMAKNEMLPKLDMILSTYVAGLEGDSRIGSAFGNQFSEGEPGYSAGFIYEFPLGNRAARTRFDRRQLEANKALFEFQATVEAGLTDVELAVREGRHVVSRDREHVSSPARRRGRGRLPRRALAAAPRSGSFHYPVVGRPARRPRATCGRRGPLRQRPG